MSDCSAVYVNPQQFRTRDGSYNKYNIMDTSHMYMDNMLSKGPCGLCKKVVFVDPSNNCYQCECTMEMNSFSGLSQSYKNSLLDGPSNIHFNYEIEMEYNGPTGPTGPMGPSGNVELSTKKTDILSVYTNRQQEITTNGFVVFDFNSVMLGNCYHEPGKAELWAWSPGYYCVYYSLYSAEPCQFSLSKNDSLMIPGSTIGSVIGSSQNTHMFVVQITDDDISVETGLDMPKLACKLQLINNTTSTPSISLIDATGSNNILPQVSASFNMYLLHT
jgi:hypothetical protein